MGRLQGARTNILGRWIPCFGQTTPDGRIRPVTRARATTPPRPQSSWTVIRDAVWKRHHLTKRRRVHVDPADDIPAAFKATGLAPRVPPLGLVTVAVYRTPPLRVAMPPCGWPCRLDVPRSSPVTHGSCGPQGTMRSCSDFCCRSSMSLAVLPLAQAQVVGAAAAVARHRRQKGPRCRAPYRNPPWRVPIGALTPIP